MKHSMVDKRLKIKFSLLEGTFWSIMGAYGAYVVSWALSEGYTQSFVSLLVIVNLVAGFLGQLIFSSLCDKRQTHKNVFLFGIVIVGINLLVLYFIKAPWLFLLCYAAYSFCYIPMSSTLDAWIVRSFRGDMKAYSSVRGAGSIGCAVAILIMGQLIGNFGYWLMSVVSIGMVVLTLILALFTPDSPLLTQAEQDSQQKFSFKELISIFRIPEYLIILAVLFFLSMSFAPMNSFKILLLQSVGGDVKMQGLDSFIGCTIQFLVFSSTALITKIPANTRLKISAYFLTGSLILYCYATNCLMVIIGTSMWSVTYGMVMPAVREITIQIVQPKFHTTAIGAMDASYNFLGGIVAQTFAGRLTENVGIHGTAMVCMIISFLTIAILFIHAILQKRQYKHTPF